tara:strand:- start:1096 stop:1617 length:522 start_codon:yes stop_codon:yes gene_type:complete
MTETKKTKKTTSKKQKALEIEIEKLKEEIDQLHLSAKRSQADLINLKRRTLEEIQINKRKTKIGLFSKFLNTLDELNMTKDSLPKEEAFKNWLTGIEMIIKKFETTLTNEGLTKIDPQKGEDFDPSIHESITTEETKTKKLDGKISHTFKSGYTIENTIIRPAQVILLKHINN